MMKFMSHNLNTIYGNACYMTWNSEKYLYVCISVCDFCLFTTDNKQKWINQYPNNIVGIIVLFCFI